MPTERERRRPRSLAVLAVILCLPLVFSFIVFEVLDVDGSDFPANPHTLGHVISFSEAEHDLRRLWPEDPRPFEMVQMFVPPAIPHLALPSADHCRPGNFHSIRTPHTVCAALPRASLEELP
jgi:hypothetical protein